jgi:hypothetical protein
MTPKPQASHRDSFLQWSPFRGRAAREDYRAKVGPVIRSVTLVRSPGQRSGRATGGGADRERQKPSSKCPQRNLLSASWAAGKPPLPDALRQRTLQRQSGIELLLPNRLRLFKIRGRLGINILVM